MSDVIFKSLQQTLRICWHTVLNSMNNSVRKQIIGEKVAIFPKKVEEEGGGEEVKIGKVMLAIHINLRPIIRKGN